MALNVVDAFTQICLKTQNANITEKLQNFKAFLFSVMCLSVSFCLNIVNELCV